MLPMTEAIDCSPPTCWNTTVIKHCTNSERETLPIVGHQCAIDKSHCYRHFFAYRALQPPTPPLARITATRLQWALLAPTRHCDWVPKNVEIAILLLGIHSSFSQHWVSDRHIGQDLNISHKPTLTMVWLVGRCADCCWCSIVAWQTDNTCSWWCCGVVGMHIDRLRPFCCSIYISHITILTTLPPPGVVTKPS